MIMSDSRAQNEAAYKVLKASIDEKYPKGHFIAIDNGQLVADAPTLAELIQKLKAQGRKPQDGLAVQAGTDYPEYADIFQGV